jgi:hypothetical protein
MGQRKYRRMNNPAASGRGIKADLLAVCCSALQFQDFAPRGGECTPTRFKNEVQHPDQDCLSAMWALLA